MIRRIRLICGVLPRIQGNFLSARGVRLRLFFRQLGRRDDAFWVYLGKALPLLFLWKCACTVSSTVF